LKHKIHYFLLSINLSIMFKLTIICILIALGLYYCLASYHNNLFDETNKELNNKGVYLYDIFQKKFADQPFIGEDIYDNYYTNISNDVFRNHFVFRKINIHRDRFMGINMRKYDAITGEDYYFTNNILYKISIKSYLKNQSFRISPFTYETNNYYIMNVESKYMYNNIPSFEYVLKDFKVLNINHFNDMKKYLDVINDIFNK